MIISDFDECLKRIAMVAPETESGCEQFYHYLSYGWLCGGIIEVPLHAHSLNFIFLKTINRALHNFKDAQNIIIGLLGVPEKQLLNVTKY